MRLSRTLAAGVGAALLATVPVAAFAETDDTDDYTAYGSAGQLAGHLTDAHGYTDVSCEKFTALNAESYTIDPAVYPNAIALRLQGNRSGKRLVLDPVTGKAYPAPEDATKINWVIVCTGTAPVEPTDPGTTDPEPTDPGTTDPEPTDPGTTDPEPTDPGTTDPEPTDPGTTDPEPTGPPVETDGPSERPVNGALWLGVGTLLAGAGALVLGRRLTQS